MSDIIGEVTGMARAHDSVCLMILLEPEHCEDASLIWEIHLGEKVAVVKNVL